MVVPEMIQLVLETAVMLIGGDGSDYMFGGQNNGVDESGPRKGHC